MARAALLGAIVGVIDGRETLPPSEALWLRVRVQGDPRSWDWDWTEERVRELDDARLAELILGAARALEERTGLSFTHPVPSNPPAPAATPRS